jgi:asparagine synthase (glutamine-hydrolysing)
MCGLAGIVTMNGTPGERLLRANACMHHRGPDAGGVTYQTPAALAFRRLAIIDLSPHGSQPMSNETGDVWIAYNGEVYGFQELRAQLEGRHAFKSRTDTEVLLHGYEEWGIEDLLKRIDGMFAFALWDARTNELFLARDRMGKKPLYYAETDDGVAFASTLNALLELLPERPGIDLSALDEFLVYQAVPTPKTIYTGVYALSPAHYGHWSAQGAFQTTRYWRLSYANKVRRSEPDLLDELDSLVRTAVERRLISDVPLGAFLSGGVDSSLVVSIMSDLGARPVQAINIAFEDPEYDERRYARTVAQTWGATLFEHLLKPDEIQNLPEIVWQYGQPLADVSIVPTYAVARAAREHVTVALNGDGGDELFGGYARPMVARAAEAVRARIPAGARAPVASVASMAGKRGRLLGAAVSKSARQAFTYDRGFRSLRASMYTRDFRCSLGDSNPDELYARVWDEADGPTDVDRALYGDAVTYLTDQLLVKMDVSTMAHSLEGRSPLLDLRLCEFATSIPSNQLLRNYQPKYLLKRLAERYVPKQVIYRRKQGFVMPASRWISTEITSHVRALLGPRAVQGRGLFQPEAVSHILEEHLSGVRDWGDQIWTLVVLEVWYRLFVDRTLDRADKLDAVL